MSSLFRFAYVMASRRAISGWRIETVLFGSILLAVSLMASGVIFSELLANAALRGFLLQADPTEVNFQVRTFSGRDDPQGAQARLQAFEARNAFVEDQVIDQFRPYLKEHARFLETATFFFQGRPHLELHRDHRPRGAFVSITNLDGRIRVLEGEWPDGTGTGVEPVRVAIDSLGAELLQLGVGEVMEVFPATSFADAEPIEVRIGAIFEVVDRSEEFWYGLSYAFSRKDERWTLVPLFADEGELIEKALGSYPSLYADTTWFLFPDEKAIKATDIGQLQGILSHVERTTSVGLMNSSYSIRLDSLLRSYEEQLLLARLPLYLVLFIVSAVLIYYLALISGLVVRSRAAEIAMLKSRGATTWQIGLLGLGEGLLLAAPAVIAGPFLALALVKILGSVFFRLSGSADALAGVPVGVSADAYLLGLAGGALAVVVFGAASLAAARSSSVEALQARARPPTTNVLHRYGLDLALLALIGVLWWQLLNQESFLVQSAGTREISINYSLLAGPVLGLVAAGLIVLRLFPLAATILARVTGPVGPSWLVHVFRHLSRDPITPAMLIVLVMLATALGVIGSSLSATIERGHRESALYDAGSDLRLQHGGLNRTSAQAASEATLRGIEGVQASAEVLRSPGYLTTTGFSTSGTLLAVDSESIDDAAWFREDFANGLTLGDLSDILQTGPEGPAGVRGDEQDWSKDGLLIPRDATAVTLWARAGSSAPGVGVWARLKDSEGRVVDEWMGDFSDTHWSAFRLDFDAPPSEELRRREESSLRELKPPLELVSFTVRNRFRDSFGGAVFFGRVDVETPAKDIVLHDYKSNEGWQVIEDFRIPGLNSLESSRSASEGEFDITGRFSWSPGGTGLTGIRAGGRDEPVPALVSSEFLDVADAVVGDTVILSMSSYSLLLRVAAEVEFFPTLDPRDRPFAIVDLPRLIQAETRYSPRPSRGPNELWLSQNAGPGEAQTAESIKDALREEGIRVRDAFDANAMVEQRVEQPLVNAGWGALLVLLFLAVALASASGLLLFAHMDARERQTEFALLRTLGISQGQMQRIVWVNLLLIALSGVGLGTLLGWLIGSSVLPLMEVVEGGERAVPSYLFTIDWKRLSASYVILAVVTVLCGLWLTWMTFKIQLQQVLRMGE